MTTDRPCPQCGASPGPLGDCRATYEELLAAERSDPGLGSRHGAVVPAYYLQHHEIAVPKFRDGQFRILQLYRERGVEGLLRFARYQRRRNSHRSSQEYGSDALAGFQQLPDRPAPTSFAAGFPTLPGPSGDFVGDGYDVYGARFDALVDATLAAWREPG